MLKNDLLSLDLEAKLHGTSAQHSKKLCRKGTASPGPLLGPCRDSISCLLLVFRDIEGSFQLGAMSIGDAWAGVMGSMSKASSFKLLDGPSLLPAANSSILPTSTRTSNRRFGLASGCADAGIVIPWSLRRNLAWDLGAMLWVLGRSRLISLGTRDALFMLLSVTL